MNYKKSLIITAITLGAGVMVNAQSAKFSLNGVGRSVLTNSNISGDFVDVDETVQKAGTAGYNLFDLQTNLAVDSNFQAMAIFRAKSPFGSFFGSATGFEFRQFKMMGNFDDFKYEIGDIRVEMTPFTVFNSYTIDHSYESDVFVQRRKIQEYENFNKGNSWLLQGAAGQYFWEINKEGMGLGVYAFGTRNTSTNESTIPDRLLTGGRLEFRVNKSLKFGANAVSMFDISLLQSDFDYNNNVFTGDVNYKFDTDAILIDVNFEGGMSMYKYNQFVDDGVSLTKSDTAYDDGFMDLNVGIGLKDAKIRFDLNARSVGVLYSSPSAQTRRYNASLVPNMFNEGQSGPRYQSMFDRSTAEEMYNSTITPNLMGFVSAYNNSTPYGKATPNRTGGSFRVGTDTSNHKIDASAKLAYLTEIQGEGTVDKRTFMVVSGGTVAHLGELFGFSRALDLNAGARYEQTSRGGTAAINYTSLLVDAGLSFELLKRISLLGGLKFISVDGNEYIKTLDGFNFITDFSAWEGSYTETLISAGLRIDLTVYQQFVVNYNMSTNVSDNITNGVKTGYDIGQLFFSYIGRF